MKKNKLSSPAADQPLKHGKKVPATPHIKNKKPENVTILSTSSDESEEENYDEEGTESQEGCGSNNGSESEPEDSEDQGKFVPEIADLEAEAREQEAALAFENHAKIAEKKTRDRKREKRQAKRKGKKRAAAREKKENDKRANLLKAASKYPRHESTDISESDDEADQNS